MKNIKYKLLLLVFIIVLNTIQTYGQLVNVSLGGHEYTAKKREQSDYKNKKVSSTILSIPFFEDFSEKYFYSSADENKWAFNSTHINNSFAINQPSYLVSTFDGLNEEGAPYNNVNVFAIGYTDELKSLPFDFSSLLPSDSLYLSFYLQNSGIGEVPDEDDFFEVQFFTQSNNWETVLKVMGSDAFPADTFVHQMIVLDKVAYFHNNFQFRFRSYGRMSGVYDVWNLDYITLDKNRTILNKNYSDQTMSSFTNVNLLKNYTSMPYPQFFQNISTELDSASFKSFDLSNGTIVMNWAYQYYDNFGVRIMGKENYAPGVTATDKSFFRYMGIHKDSIKNINQPLRINFKAWLEGQSDNRKNNDTIYDSVILWDYYAYDDGSPEFALGTTGIGARVANQFVSPINDVLTHIDIDFVRSRGPNMTGRSVLLTVWDENFKILYQAPIQIDYNNNRYSVGAVNIDAGKKFYVGYLQNFNDLVTVGHDINNTFSDKIFFSSSSDSWLAYTSQAGYKEGALMIRAVFSKNEQLLSVKNENINNSTEDLFYPNPTIGVIYFNDFKDKVVVYSLAGIEIASYSHIKEVDMSMLANGIYIVKIFNESSVLTKKLYKN